VVGHSWVKGFLKVCFAQFKRKLKDFALNTFSCNRRKLSEIAKARQASKDGINPSVSCGSNAC